MPENLRTETFLSGAMQTFGDAVLRLAVCRLHNRADAEDVFQDVFLRLLRDGTAFDDDEHLKAWLLRVTLHRCSDLRRSAWFRRTAPLDAVAEMPAFAQDEQKQLWLAVAKLPEDQRTAVHLHYAEGYSTEEIAALTGCRAATVRTRLHRARTKLKGLLEEDDDEPIQSYAAERANV